MFKAGEPEQAEYIAYQHVGTSEMLEESVGDGLVDVDDSIMDSSEYSYEKLDPNNFMNTETGRRRYRMRHRTPAAVYYCDKCDKSFKYPSKIQEHMRKHTGEKPFSCETCGAKFSQSHVLKAHIRSHQGEKPFKCSYCDRCFATIAHRNQHEKSAHISKYPPERLMANSKGEVVESLDEIFECTVFECGYRSLDRPEVEEHIAIVHNYEDDPHLVQDDHIWTDYSDEQPAEMLDQEYGVYLGGEITSQEIDEAGSSRQEAPTLEEANPAEIHEIEAETALPSYQVQSMKKEEQEDYPPLVQEVHYEQEELYETDVFVETTIEVPVDPNPPKRGKNKLAPFPNRSVVIDMDLRTVQNIQPKNMAPKGSKKRTKEARNLDWVIDAVAKGLDVAESSPHNRKKPQTHTCQICGKIDKYPSKILAHMRTHTKEKPYKCEICGMQFSQRTPMRLHLRRHLNQKPFVCQVDGCGENFVSNALLNQHVSKKHLKMKKYVCIKGCGRYFASNKNQRAHEFKCCYNRGLEDDVIYQQLVYEDESDEEEYEDRATAPEEADEQHNNTNWEQHEELLAEEVLSEPLGETAFIDHEEEYVESS